MTVGPGKVRLQITVPTELRDHLEETGRAAGLNAREVACLYLAEGAARTRAQASLSAPCGPEKPEHTGRSTRPKSNRKSAAPQADAVADEDDDVDLTAEEVVELLPKDELADLRRDGWTPEKIAEFLNEE